MVWPAAALPDDDAGVLAVVAAVHPPNMSEAARAAAPILNRTLSPFYR